MKRQVPEATTRIFCSSCRKEATGILKSAEDPQGVFESFRSNGSVRALVMLTPGIAYSFLKLKGNHWQFKILCDWEDPDALAWTRTMLAKHRTLLKSHEFAGFMDAGLWSLLPDLKRCGISIEAVSLIGRTKLAIKKCPTSIVWPSGYFVRRVQKKDIRELLSLMRTEFRRNPQFGWFVSHPQFLKMARDGFLKDCKRKRPFEFVVIVNRKIVGHFGAHVTNPHGFGYKSASIGIGFKREHQGRGLSRLCYQEAVKVFSRERVKFFMGVTAQPAVMKIGAELGRELISFNMSSRKPYFTNDCFLKYPIWPKGIKVRPKYLK